MSNSHLVPGPVPITKATMTTFAYVAQDLSDARSDTSTSGVSRPSTPPLQITEEVTIDGPQTPKKGATDAGDGPPTPSKMEVRAYQLEMFQMSLKQNIVVAMDTGSGKTQIALLRMQAELDTCAPEKIIWFLAPTIILCHQQYDIIQKQIPLAPAKLLTGNENVDSWSNNTWDTVLRDTRIIVSTPAVLHDALCHAFVRMDMLALIVFDEAHNSIKKAPSRRVMLDFYHVRKRSGQVPAILGLSATPSIRALETGLEDIERTLDARCVTPTIHREQLLKYANRPVIRGVEFSIPKTYEVSTPAIKSLKEAWHSLDIREDPYIISLLENLTDRNRIKLSKAINENDTYCQNQLKGLFRRSLQIACELGLWASNRYLQRVIGEYLAKVHENHNQLPSEEKMYLGRALNKVQLPLSSDFPSDVSEKANLLIQELLAGAAAESPLNPPVCVVFAKQRSTVSMLYELLTASPSVSEKFRIGAVVGFSQYVGKKAQIYDLLSNVSDTSALQKFRSGAINLLIATDVLEEGIDIPACNLVICFDALQTFKSFIQRRGRARMRVSNLVIFSDRSDSITQQWEAMEEQIKKQCQDEDREHQRIMDIEEHGDEDGADLVLLVESTGARIGLDEAKGHLSHFCRKLSRGEFIDPRPDFMTQEHHTGTGMLVTCKVVLPSFLPTSIRESQSSRSWETETHAMQDAALQAYVKLYHAGLVNDHLLPYTLKEITDAVEGREAIAIVDHSFKPWIQVARDWEAGSPRWAYTFTCINEKGNVLGEYVVVLPAELPQPPDITIYRDFGAVWTLWVSAGRQLAPDEVIRDHTSALLATVFNHRWPVLDKPHVIQVCVNNNDNGGRSHVCREQIGSRAFNIETDMNQDFLVRDANGVAFTYEELLPAKPPAALVRRVFDDYELAPESVPYIVLKKWTRRSDFLHALTADPSKTGPESSKPYGWLLPLDWATVDSISIHHVQFGMLIPSVIHQLEIMLTVKHLTENLLKPVGISNTQLVREAISSRGALEPYQYERLENLGDSILKYCAVIQAFSTHPEWPEGYLSFFKEKLVSNARLSRAAMEKGLAKYILTKSFTGAKWKPLYLEDVLKSVETKEKKAERLLSTKTLADVVESLIGAAYQDGGIEKATKCLQVFVDDQSWRTPTVSRQMLYDAQTDIAQLPKTMMPLEELIGYEFNKKAIILEAMTHGSFMSTLGGRSYERLEFIGDAVLDKIIITRLFAVEPPLSHDKMHTLKTAMVNGDFLAFISLEYGLHREETAVIDGELGTQEVVLPLWKFMRQSNPAVGVAQAEVEQRYRKTRDELLYAMNKATHYPWATLAKIRAHKFFSDVFEAMLGAVWLDSGSLRACEEIIARFGFFKYLERILREGVECQHPKEVLGKCAVDKTVKYEMEILDKGNGEREFTCAVYVGDRLVTKVDGGVGNEEAKTKAATDAVRIMTAELNGMDLD